MFNKPYDIVVMVAIFAAVFVTIGFGITAIQEEGGVIDAKTSGFFNSTNSRITNTSFFGGTVSSAGEAIVGTDGSSDEESGIVTTLKKGFKSLLSLGKTYAYAQESLIDAQGILGIPPVYVTLVVGVLLVTLMVIIYTWLRGSV